MNAKSDSWVIYARSYVLIKSLAPVKPDLATLKTLALTRLLETLKDDAGVCDCYDKRSCNTSIILQL